MSDVLEPPRWNNGPAICTLENLPAFPTLATAHDFHKDRNRGGSVVNMRGDPWLCDFCQHWHYQSDHAGSHGYADGNARSGLLPKGWEPFRRQLRPSAFEGTTMLPKQERPAKELALPRKKAQAKPQREATLI